MLRKLAHKKFAHEKLAHENLLTENLLMKNLLMKNLLMETCSWKTVSRNRNSTTLSPPFRSLPYIFGCTVKSVLALVQLSPTPNDGYLKDAYR
jgi:hypothetical protein